FTSPHLVEFAERIRVNGEMIPRDTLAAEISFMKNLAEGWEQPPTFFELALAVALRHFISNGADFIILETGLGGRLDATNALRKDISVLAPIGLDHQQYLGNTLAEIAGEKAAIIAPGKPVVTAVQEPEAMAVIEWTARERLSPLTVARANSGTPRPSLPGPHQIENAALALETMKQLNALPESALIERALKSVQWPGRFERIGTPPLVLDGAHNEHAARVLTATWNEEFPGQKAALVFAAAADKQIRDMIPVFREIAGEWHLVPCSSPRIMPAEDMVALLKNLVSEPVFIHSSLSEGLRKAVESPLPALAAGSLFLLGDLKALLHRTEKRTTSQ
ncbi:MAG: bifunctional folylpolyglutamate synthase/dihydrofolate synthase, partial [Akkermansia sp.]